MSSSAADVRCWVFGTRWFSIYCFREVVWVDRERTRSIGLTVIYGRRTGPYKDQLYCKGYHTWYFDLPRIAHLSVKQ